MKFTVSTSGLTKQLQLAAGALTSNPVMPVLEDFLFELKGNTLNIASSNLEVSIRTSIEVSGSKNGKIAVPGKTILDVLKSLPEQPLTFEINLETRGIELLSASGKYKLVGENSADFPEIETPSEADDKIEISSEFLKKGIDKSSFAASNDEMRQNMRGINLNIDFNQITFATTDAQKLVRYRFLDITSNVATSLLLTKKSMQLLSSILPKDGKVAIHFNKSKVFFIYDNILFTTRLVDAKFPDYNAVIPVDNSNILTINRDEILSTLKRMTIFANKSTSQIVMSLNEGSLTMNAQDFDFNNEATEQLSCSYEGESLNIGLSAKNLIEMLSVLDSESVQFQFNSSNKPVLLVPTDQKKGEDLLMLIVTNS
ncbi:MAG: DNA polymerase III subunit beta [Saprospiraceae bacterium]|nr:DNA polymerase III subunit beta [Saprospiraceae bacterium]